MRSFGILIIASTLAGCAQTNSANIIGLNSFALAARYGTPDSYKLQGEYMQLNYGSEAAGCRVIVLVDQDQRVVGWASAGGSCSSR